MIDRILALAAFVFLMSTLPYDRIREHLRKLAGNDRIAGHTPDE